MTAHHRPWLNENTWDIWHIGHDEILTSQVDLYRMKSQSPHSKRPNSSRFSEGVLRIVLIYSGISMLYILFSDALVSRLLSTPEAINLASTIKGWLFILITSLLLYLLMNRLVGQISRAAQREQALQAEQLHTLTLLNSITHNSTDAIFIKDKQGRYIVVNPALAKLLDRPLDKIIGQNDFQLFPEPIAQQFSQDDQRIMASGKTKTYHESVVTKNKTLPYLTTKGPLVIEGKIEGIFAIARDISALKQAENEIRAGLHNAQEHEAELRAIFQALPDLYFRISADGVILDYRSQNSSELYAPAEAFLGKRTPDVLPGEFAQLLASKISQACNSDAMQVFEYDLIVSETSRHYEARLTRLTDQDQLICIVRDITDQHQAKQALFSSEQRFRTIFEQAAVGVALIDSRSGRILRINQRYCDMVGYTMEEITAGNTFQDITHPDDRQADLENLTAMLAGKIDQFSTEKRYLHQDGSIVWGNLTVSATWQPHEEPDNYIEVVIEITTRKQAEAALRESEQQLRTLINATPDIICFKDGQGRWLQANEADLELFSLTDVDYRGKTDRELAEFTEPFYRDAFLACEDTDEATWQRGEISRCAEAIPTRDGTIKTYDVIKIPLYEENGIRKGLIVLGRDITERQQSELQLARAESEWTQAMDQFQDIIYLIDTQRRLLRANQAFYRMTGSDARQCQGQHIADLIHRDRNEASFCPVCQAQEQQRETTITLEPHHPGNPSGRPFEATLKVLRDDAGNAIGMLTSLHDLTHSRQIEERLRLAASVFENTNEGVIITDPDGNILDVNLAFSQIQGYSREEVIGKNPRLFKSGHHDQSFYRDLWRSLVESGHWRGEMWNRRKSGELFPKWQTINSVVDSNGNLTHYVGIFSDITHIKQSQEKLDHLGHHDALTDLPNRLLLNERLDQAIKHAERHDTLLAVIFLDLDNFKHINDSLGHPVGDQLLQEAARKLLLATRQDDTVARIGGDEFVLLLEDIGKPENAGIAAQKIAAVFAEPFQLAEQTIRITASLGICICPQDGNDSATLLRNADSAMYRAKEEGRNTYQFYTEELTRNAFERVSLENNLRQAIEKEQLCLLYQPQFDLQSGKVIGLEALIRWVHPELGTISPAKFIPLAEESGLIHPIGQWVLRTACRQGRQWQQQGIDFGRIAVNIAGPQLQRGNLVNEVIAVLDETQLPTDRLELEVTEGFIMQQAGAAITQLQALRELGLTLSIDDFGTGYSSLSYLKQLPIHKLKIDQSFVHDIPDDHNDMAIADAIIAMGKSLGLTVIAEGVETEAQANFLKAAGCQEGQGYLYSRPVSAEEIERLLAGPMLVSP